MKNLFKFLTVLSMLSGSAAFAQIGIGTTTPDASAVLDVASTTKGLLAPRHSTTTRNAIATPANGLLIFNTTTNQLETNTGTTVAPVWTAVGATSSFYTSDGTTSAARTVTLAANPLAFTSTATNGFSVDGTTFSVDATNNRVGIGNATPGFPLDVTGEAKATRLLAYGAGGVSTNTAIGSSSLNANTTGFNNTAVGTNSLEGNTTGAFNTAVGNFAIQNSTTGSYNTAIGRNAGSTITTGSSNLVLGSSSTGITTGNGNVVIGISVTSLSPTSTNNVVIADGVGNRRINVDGSGNVGIANTAPTEKLDVTGNVKFSGALMPNNTAGTAGQVLTSAGAGAVPTWTTVSGGSTYTAGSGLTLTGSAFSANDATTLAKGTVQLAGDLSGTAALPTIATNAVTSAKILDATVANADLAAGAGGIYKGDGALAANTTVTGGTNTLAFTSTATNGFSVDGTTFSVDGANNRVGFGTATPAYPLDVTGEARATRLLAFGAGNVNTNTAVGALTLNVNTTGPQNTAVGDSSLKLNTTGGYNTAVGSLALESNTTGDYNTAIGRFAGATISTGTNNIVLGTSSTGITTGSGNVVIGNSVTGLSTSLTNNVVIADGAGNRRINVDGSGNVGIANTAPTEKLDVTGNVRFSGALMPNNTAGTAGQVLTSTGAGTVPTWTTPASTATASNGLTATSGNVKIGGAISEPTTISALTATNKLAITGTGVDAINFDSNTLSIDATNNRVGFGTATPAYPLDVNGEAKATRLIAYGTGNISTNTAVGSSSLNVNTTGGANTAVGYSALPKNTTGSYNTSLGANSLIENTTGGGNTVIGESVMLLNTTGVDNVAIGRTALMNNTIGNENTAIGKSSGNTITTGSNNVILGPSTTGITTGSGNVVIGRNVTGLTATLANNIVLADGVGNQRINVDGSGNVGIANAAPTEKLDVTGNVRFSGALMPNNTAGTAGQVLTSAGAGTVPTWTTPASTATASNGLTATSGNVKIGGAISEPTTISALTATNKLAITGTGVDAINFDSNTLSIDATNNRVGIGNATPGFPLDVTGEAKATRLLAYGAGGVSTNTAIGSSSLNANTTGFNNTAVGTNSLEGNTTGAFNTAVGNFAIQNSTTGSYNTAIGRNAGSTITTGSSNLVLGSSSTGITTGNGNVVIGISVTSLSPTSTNNVVIADGVGNRRINVDGSGNVGIANTAPTEKLDVTGNVKFSGALMPNNTAGTAGQVLTSAGAGAVPTWTTVSGGSTYTAGSGLTLTGSAFSANDATTLAKGTVQLAGDLSGTAALPTIATNAVTSAKILDATVANADLAAGAGGIYKGDGALAANTTVTGGTNTLAFTSTATNGFSVDGTTFSVDGANNRVGFGTATPAYPLDVTGEARATRLLAFGAGNVNTNTAVGALTLNVNTTGPQNTAVGDSSLKLNTTGGYNTAVGSLALESNTTGDYNTAIGRFAGATISTGANNIVLGTSSTGITTGSGNVVIGNSVTGLSTSLTNNVVIADGAGNRRINVDGSGNVGIANTAPTEKLDVTGNVRFSGALMPNNTAGTAGQVLTSAGAGAVPTWTTVSGGTSTLTNGNIFVGNASNVATGVALSGDATITNAGALTIGTGAVTSAKILDGTVAAGDLASDAVTSAKILDATVANADLAAGAGGIYKGSGSLAGATTITGAANTLAITSTVANGFSVDGTTLSVDAANDRIGIGTTTPASKLEVDGSVTNKSSIADTDLNIDFSASNLAYTSASAGAIVLTNIKDGGTYTLNLRGATSGTSTFTASGFTFKSVNNGATTASKETIYTFLVMGTNVYVYMVTGI